MQHDKKTSQKNTEPLTFVNSPVSNRPEEQSKGARGVAPRKTAKQGRMPCSLPLVACVAEADQMSMGHPARELGKKAASPQSARRPSPAALERVKNPHMTWICVWEGMANECQSKKTGGMSSRQQPVGSVLCTSAEVSKGCYKGSPAINGAAAVYQGGQGSTVDCGQFSFN